MLLRTISKNISSKIDTALSALRRGSMVVIRDQNQRGGFIRAAEFADYEIPEIPDLTQIAPTLCFTRQHVQFLRPHTTTIKPVFSLPANTLTGEQIVGLSIGESKLLPQNIGLLPEHENSLPDLATKVTKFAKLLPSVL